MTLFPPLDKRNTRDKAKGLRITSVRPIFRIFARPERAWEWRAHRDFHRVCFADGPWCMHATGL